MWGSITLWVLAAYISLFVWQCLRQRQWLWLVAAIALWLGTGMFSARLVPGILGPAHLGNVYVPFLYIVFASVCLWLPRRARNGDGRGGNYLILLAVSGVLQHLSFLLLVLLVCSSYPQGMSLYVWPSLLQLYGLQPVCWIGCQWVLMAVFYVHWRLNGVAAGRFSSLQLQGGFLLSLLFQAAYVLWNLASGYGGVAAP